ncbi:MAG: diaminopimelate epimerase [Gammaproteobacteria bacterium RIFCSPHIGHO2_12_FULL_38_11]|nr:MAG: diaminopimelate epimerase [Gammaproteobacteria bacterium RIFCSPHIGHO2_12_FULL_38_11]
MNELFFTKMHALGNDFVVLDTIRQSVTITPEFIRHIANRHRGVGCDQVLLLTPTENPAADFGYRIFNADGNEVYQCGNGARCMGLFIQSENLSEKKIIYLATRHHVMRVACLPLNQIEVDIAIPNFNPASLPFITTEKAAPYHLQLSKHHIIFDVVNVGNPHCIIRVENEVADDIIDIGKQLNEHPVFPQGVNVGFVYVQSRDAIKLNVYERGVGLTEACGSGACAAVAIGRYAGYLNETVTVHQAGGLLRVTWPSDDAMIQLQGSATIVFRGVW